ncbi:adenylate cyclase type 1-like [Phyllostomus discolor]|uniref:Adenylate cyclase type 1-like n=1 Tax=Phyllostomus discolor TaxID=89673 RepID=A0A7E6CH75_9CHIR|nr:adenylate cyclase type 1-like [Phyllostomus discolor]
MGKLRLRDAKRETKVTRTARRRCSRAWGAERAAESGCRRGLRACDEEFACPELEALFRGYTLRLEQAATLKALAMLSLLAGALALAELLGAPGPAPGLAKGSHPVHCVLFLALLVGTNVRSLQVPQLQQVGQLALFFSLTFALLCCPFALGGPAGLHAGTAAGPAAADQGVWQLPLVTFVSYALLPVRSLLAVGFGLVVAASHLLVTATLVPAKRPRLWRTLGANALLFVGVNVYGVCARVLAQRSQRRAFLQARTCIEDRLRLEDENEKQERLLMSLLPRNVAMEMKEDFLKPPERIFHKIYIQRHDNVEVGTAGDRLLSRSREPGSPGVGSRGAPQGALTNSRVPNCALRGAEETPGRESTFPPPVRGPQRGPAAARVRRRAPSLSAPTLSTGTRRGCRLAHTDDPNPAAQPPRKQRETSSPTGGAPLGWAKVAGRVAAARRCRTRTQPPRRPQAAAHVARRGEKPGRDRREGRAPETPDTGAALGGLLRGRGPGRRSDVPPRAREGSPRKGDSVGSPGGPGRRPHLGAPGAPDGN